MKTLGRPSFEAEFDKNAWYYVSRETRQFGFNRPKPREQMVLVVQFDPKGTVSNVARHGMEAVLDSPMVRDQTPPLARNEPKSGVSGKSWSGRVTLGGGRIIDKKKQT